MDDELARPAPWCNRLIWEHYSCQGDSVTYDAESYGRQFQFTMSNSSICLKAINDLLTDEHGEPTRFWIPDYQRGYRWTTLEVTQLLDDVWEFIQDGKGAFYCLQPLVVKVRNSGDFEVVDGQQRLTTIYILITYLRTQAEALEKQPFRIHFETRGEANGPFLENIDLSKAEENVDFFYMCEAYEAIKNWFSDRDGSIKLKLLQHFLSHDDAGPNVKVIWFQLGSNDNAVSAFTRLNVGKIALTNDELIRALFLKSNNGEEATESQLRIAYEWDQLEKSLQSDSFWYFLNNESGRRQNRIGFIFELIAKAEPKPRIANHDAYWIFYEYSSRFRNDGVSPDSEWLSVKQAFMMLEEWYEDRRLYHIVGFLIEQGEKVTDVWALSKGIPKSVFERKLLDRIFSIVVGGSERPHERNELRERVGEALSNLQYGLHSKRIRSTLLLFNVATLLENPNSNLRFQFDSFKREHWDIEHVRSVTSRRPVRHHERVKWFELCVGFLETQEKEAELCEELKEFTSLSQSDASEADFSSLYERVLKVFQETDGDESDDGISNLTLLDRTTNRSYKNSVFAVKRQRLLSLDQSGVFVPLCTRNVFLKCYSQQADNVMFWSTQDRSCYLDSMIDALVNFFSDIQDTD